VGTVRAEKVAKMLEAAEHATEAPLAVEHGEHGVNGCAVEIRVGMGSCCVAGGSGALREALVREAQAAGRGGAKVKVKPIGCTGMCHLTPLVEVRWAGNDGVATHSHVHAADAIEIVRRHGRSGLAGAVRGAWRAVENRLLGRMAETGEVLEVPPERDVRAFIEPQVRIATEHAGEMDPLDLDEYIAHEGFEATTRARGMEPAAIVEMVKASGLRGRGGAGFPTGRKWELAAAAKGEKKYIICNGDEGDPGAFMDRMLLESYPFRVLEGMLIAGRAIGATHGIFYIRAEYPLAVSRVAAAIELAKARGLLGDLEVKIKQGAGAFVCGEETALIASIEGQRGMPRLRPPYPVEQGLWGMPTCINNVETMALLPWITRHGAAAFAGIGTATSKGTKVFALTGKLRRGGLIEVPMGMTIRQIVEDIGGGATAGRTFKAVQIGGPSGGCVPAALADTPVDYESLAKVGSIMGSGGLVVLDDTDCMVDIAKYFLSFTQAESCGQCTFCRIGTKRMLEILTRLTEGKGRAADLEALDDLARNVKTGSLCGLGQTAPNPVLSTLRYFREEYEAHIRGECPAGKCKGLIRYVVKENCNGCTKCAQACPVGAIPFTPYKQHVIDDAVCTRCDVCRTQCETQAIVIESGKVRAAVGV
jgi:NADH-quinone oxidoreductase subunit F